jgi:hypothetical protein
MIVNIKFNKQRHLFLRSLKIDFIVSKLKPEIFKLTVLYLEKIYRIIKLDFIRLKDISHITVI